MDKILEKIQDAIRTKQYYNLDTKRMKKHLAPGDNLNPHWPYMTNDKKLYADVEDYLYFTNDYNKMLANTNKGLYYNLDNGHLARAYEEYTNFDYRFTSNNIERFNKFVDFINQKNAKFRKGKNIGVVQPPISVKEKEDEDDDDDYDDYEDEYYNDGSEYQDVNDKKYDAIDDSIDEITHQFDRLNPYSSGSSISSSKYLNPNFSSLAYPSSKLTSSASLKPDFSVLAVPELDDYSNDAFDGSGERAIDNPYFRKMLKLPETLEAFEDLKIYPQEKLGDKYKSSIQAKPENNFKPSVNKNLRPRIPKAIRSNVWEKHFGKNTNGACFCCCNDIDRNQWHAGHVKSYHEGGADTMNNLKPLCVDCNLSMTSLHLYEYMLKHQTDGVKNLPIDKDFIFYSGLIKISNEARVKLEKLWNERKINKKEVDHYISLIFSSKNSLESRIKALNEVKEL